MKRLVIAAAFAASPAFGSINETFENCTIDLAWLIAQQSETQLFIGTKVAKQNYTTDELKEAMTRLHSAIADFREAYPDYCATLS